MILLPVPGTTTGGTTTGGPVVDELAIVGKAPRSAMCLDQDPGSANNGRRDTPFWERGKNRTKKRHRSADSFKLATVTQEGTRQPLLARGS